MGASGTLGVGKIDDVIHGRLRLGVMAYLANAEVADFNELKALLEVTQGNLSVQLRKLEDAGYVDIEKGFLGRKPRTQVRITAAGRKAFRIYLEALGRLIGPQT
ncbi:MAG: winged helix-turn-helix domain-containing protein [Phenylobacterium sp.]